MECESEHKGHGYETNDRTQQPPDYGFLGGLGFVRHAIVYPFGASRDGDAVSAGPQVGLISSHPALRSSDTISLASASVCPLAAMMASTSVVGISLMTCFAFLDERALPANGTGCAHDTGLVTAAVAACRDARRLTFGWRRPGGFGVCVWFLHRYGILASP